LGGNISSKIVEHRDVHSLYGLYCNKITYEALLERSKERPFILSRSFYPGAQKYGAIWSGDSASDWENFEKCVPILL
jgi:alpha-glucosidase (family GH31 glycosyl hydrolase)